ncbi:hypothetical protein A3F66_05605 [candidate division TM6 bacterium RIFCSPHIGHO2_12_FULL_32_22]|nr:MAG: hypothetical protein A3F66_05605 [candidate division TM6 bacterium RIFCSPHIGHO2_12_FULL_32_22]
MFKRNIKSSLERALKRSPVTLLTGARQSGKTILTENIAQEKNYNFFSLDDIATYVTAKNDPTGFIRDLPKPVVIDEVQRVPELFLSIKRDVDKNRKSGNYLLTGSVNPLLVPKVADALTGRIETLSLFPLSQGEILGIKENFIDRVFSGKKPANPDNKVDLYKAILVGGYPVLQSLNEIDRKAWINEYIKNIVQKDAQDITKITEPKDLYSFIYSLAHRAAGLLNISDISRNLTLPQATLQRYSSLLEALYIIYFAYPWHMKSDKKFIKSKKSYLVDSGFLSNLLKINSKEMLKESNMVGNIVENFIVMELLKQLSWSETIAELYHFRTVSGVEVDIVLEDEYKNLVAIEVKNSATVYPDDFKNLSYFKELVGKKFVKGIVLYNGEQILPFGENLLAVPINSLWSV